jgi:predicted CoA-binding protein
MKNKHTLVIGASENPDRYSFKAINMLRNHQHDVKAFGIKKGQVADVTFDTTFPTNSEFDTITLYINPQIQSEYQEAILALKPKRVIFNPGTENDSFQKTLEQNGIEALEACTLVLLQTGQY